MVSNFHLPPFGFGPGSQPVADEDGVELEYMALPTQMQVFEPHLPEIDNEEIFRPALTLLKNIADAASSMNGVAKRFDLNDLDDANRGLIDETFGKGEVSCTVACDPLVEILESVFAGIWMVTGDGPDRIEIAAIPDVVLDRAFVTQSPAIGPLTPKMPGVFNAPALITEFMEKSRDWTPGELPHVVNLTLLPHTPEDLNFLEMALGQGSVAIHSRGYGDCKIWSTGLQNVWKVQFFNSQGVLILDTYEVTTIPEVALAASEDFVDSGARLIEVLEAIR